MWNWSIFLSTTNKNKNGCEYILFRIDVYFTGYFLAAEIDEQNHESRELLFKEKRQKTLKKNLVANLLELIQVTQKRGYDTDYEVSKIQAFISKFKDKKIKEKENKIKELENKTKKLKLQLTNQSV